MTPSIFNKPKGIRGELNCGIAWTSKLHEGNYRYDQLAYTGVPVSQLAIVSMVVGLGAL